MDELGKDSNDIFAISKKNTTKIFDAAKKTNPKYHQSIVKLQHDYIDAWKNVINSAISLELEYANNAGSLTNVSESTLQTIREMTELSIQAYLKQNMFLSDSVDTIKQSFSSFNATTKSFTNLNKEIMEYLMSIYDSKLST